MSKDHYFPLDAVDPAVLATVSSYLLPLEDKASYYDVEVTGKLNQGAAWFCRSQARRRNRSRDASRLEGVQVID
ncbi:MAG: DUF427 domain-containing protein [Chloroflexi bacterium]|nr:DUF427 domain-containing protein [Chloroflexota bacterium]